MNQGIICGELAAVRSEMGKRIFGVSAKGSDKTSDNKSRCEGCPYVYECNELPGVGWFCTFSPRMNTVLRHATVLHHEHSIPVLLEGETGTGKELLARYIHSGGLAVDGPPYVAVNCAALPGELFESELFGYERGAFTGASTKGKKGFIDAAEGGTLFLDEITEMPIGLQAKLLRLIQEGTFYRVGSTEPQYADVRIIAATNRDSKKAMNEGRLRQDLYFRFAPGRIFIPPLRERKEDIIPIAQVALKRMARIRKKRFERISDELCEMLFDYDWPGNVRELIGCIEYGVMMWDDYELKPFHVQEFFYPQLKTRKRGDKAGQEDADSTLLLRDFQLPANGFDLEEFIDKVVYKALEMHNGNKSKTARYLKISRGKLYSLLKRPFITNCTKGV